MLRSAVTRMATPGPGTFQPGHWTRGQMTFHCGLPCATQGAYWCPQSPRGKDPTVWHPECLQISVVAQAETGLSGQVIQLVRCVSPRSCSGPSRGMDRAGVRPRPQPPLWSQQELGIMSPLRARLWVSGGPHFCHITAPSRANIPHCSPPFPVLQPCPLLPLLWPHPPIPVGRGAVEAPRGGGVGRCACLIKPCEQAGGQSGL